MRLHRLYVAECQGPCDGFDRYRQSAATVEHGSSACYVLHGATVRGDDTVLCCYLQGQLPADLRRVCKGFSCAQQALLVLGGLVSVLSMLDSLCWRPYEWEGVGTHSCRNKTLWDLHACAAFPDMQLQPSACRRLFAACYLCVHRHVGAVQTILCSCRMPALWLSHLLQQGTLY